MANLNRVMLIGRLTRDPEAITTRGDGSTVGAKFGFAVNNRKKNADSGQYEDVPVFIDMEAWNRGENKMGDRIASTLKKGQQVYIEGCLKLDQWEDSNGGGKRQKLLVTVENFQYLEPRGEAQAPVTAGKTAPSKGGKAKGGKSAARNADYDDQDPLAGGTEDEIPF